MRFGVLGPLLLADEAGAPVRLSSPVQRVLLATLLCAGNRAVSVDQLMEAVWAGDPPPSARASLRVHLHHLRRTADLQDRLSRQPGGQLLTVRPEDLDSAEFERLAVQGHGGLLAGDPRAAAVLLRRALGLWRGDPYEDVQAGQAVRVEVQRLADLRLTAREDCFDAELSAGAQPPVVAEIRAALARNPLRERLRGQLMSALYQTGCQAEAIAVYEEGRRLLADELGVDPDAELRALHLTIVRGEPVRRAGPAPAAGSQPVAAQLPAGQADFSGRREELSKLDALTRAAAGATTRIVVISGQAGVGKTALAVHWGQRERQRFPDGQLYVNLHGFDGADSVRSEVALRGFLRALGMAPSRIPDGRDDAAALFRSAVAGRRLLVLLDNAAAADQVRPLLPGGAGCVVLVTSRDRLPGLVARESARRIDLRVLAGDESVQLLARLLGADRVGAEPAATAALAVACGQLPLAIRIAASSLTDRPDRSIAEQATALGGADRLAELEIQGDEASAVRPALHHSYARLTGPGQRMLRLIGLIPCPDVTAESAAAASGDPPAEAGRLLHRLVQASLVQTPQAGRYDCHDLIRLFARELTVKHDTAGEREVALRRLTAYYIAYAGDADSVLQAVDTTWISAVFVDQPAAVAWFDAECPSLLALLPEVVRRGWHPETWQLAGAMRRYLRRLHRIDDWLTSHQLGLAAALAAGDLAAAASMHDGLASAYYQAQQWESARAHWTAAAAACRTVGDERGWAGSHDNLGILCQQLGDNAAAERHHLEALSVPAYAAEPKKLAFAHVHLGIVYGATGRYAECRESLGRALSLGTELRNWELVCFARHNLAELAMVTGEVAAAHSNALEQVRVARAGRLPLREARGLHFLGDIVAPTDPAGAATYWRAALALYDGLKHPLADSLRERLS